jgi:hypothetical protein
VGDELRGVGLKDENDVGTVVAEYEGKELEGMVDSARAGGAPLVGHRAKVVGARARAVPCCGGGTVPARLGAGRGRGRWKEDWGSVWTGG